MSPTPDNVSRIGLAAPASLDDVPPAPWEIPTPLTDVERPPTFPLDCLPEPTRSLVQLTAEQLGHNDAALVAIALLPTVAAVVAGRWVVNERPGRFEPLQLFTVGIGDPSTGKTPAFEEMARPLFDLDLELGESFRLDNADAESRRRIDEQKRRTLEGKAAANNATADELRELEDLVRHLANPLPTPPRLVTTDSTAEALGALMANNGGRIAQLDDEPGVLGMMAGRYQSRGAPPNLDAWLKGWAGSPLIVDRSKSPEPYRIPRPSLTLGIMSQPSAIRGASLGRDTEGRGVMARFLYAWPALEPVDFSVVPAPVPEHLARAYVARLRELHALSCTVDPQSPRVLTVDADATEALRAWFGQVARLEAAEPGGTHLREWLGKIGKQTQRLAGVLTLLDDPHATSVDLEHVTAAVRLARDYFTPQARRVFGELAQSDRMRRATLCLEAIRTGAGRGWERWPAQVKAAEVRQVVRSHRSLELDDAEVVTDALALLVDRDYLRPAPVTADEHKGPGRPVRWYEVNPATFGPPADEPAPVVELEADAAPAPARRRKPRTVAQVDPTPAVDAEGDAILEELFGSSDLTPPAEVTEPLEDEPTLFDEPVDLSEWTL